MALLSHMARLGTSDPVELRTDMEELVQGFDLSHFGAAPTKFDVDDLFPLTAHYNQSLTFAEVADYIRSLGVPDDLAEAFWNTVRENITVLDDLKDWWALCRDGAKPLVADEDKEFIEQALAMLPERPWDTGTWGAWTKAVKEATGRKGRALFMPLRKALTGMDHGPDMSHLLPLLQGVKR